LSNKQHAPGGIAEMLAIALPMVISMACDGVMVFTDRLFLARISPVHMNASMGGGVMVTTFILFFIGLTGYSTALVAQYLGAGRKEKSATVTFQAIIISFASYPILLALRPLAMIFFKWMKIPPEQIVLQNIYFSIIIYGSLFGILRNSLSGFFSGIGKTRFIMIAALTSMIVNVGVNYILIFGKLGFPAMGIKGAAIGTVIGSFVGLIMLLFAYLTPSNRKEFKVLQSFRFDKEVMQKLLYFGYPQGLESFLNLMAFSSMIYIFYAQGNVVATATTIMFNWDYVSFIPLIGMEIGVTSLVGRYMGAGSPDIAHKATISGIKMGFIFSAICFVFFTLMPEPLVRMFHPTESTEVFEQAVPIAVTMLRIATLYVLAEAVMISFIGALRGAGDTHWAMRVSVILHWLFVPLLWVFFNVFKLSAIGGWIGLVGFILVFCLVFALRYKQGKWRNMKVIDNPPMEVPEQII
jgi:MATE family multidrug resistance protein